MLDAVQTWYSGWASANTTSLASMVSAWCKVQKSGRLRSSWAVNTSKASTAWNVRRRARRPGRLRSATSWAARARYVVARMPRARDEANRRAARDQETELSTLRADLRVITRLNAWNVVSSGGCARSSAANASGR